MAMNNEVRICPSGPVCAQMSALPLLSFIRREANPSKLHFPVSLTKQSLRQNLSDISDLQGSETEGKGK